MLGTKSIKKEIPMAEKTYKCKFAKIISLEYFC